MKKTIIALILLFSTGKAQGDIYPTETSYGGGIGYSTMYMVLDSLPGEEIFKRFGLPSPKYRPLVFHGGEGFAQMTGPWRLGGYAGIASSQSSSAPKVVLFKDVNGNGRYDDQILWDDDDQDVIDGKEVAGTQRSAAEDQEPQLDGSGNNRTISVNGKASFLMGAMTIEYVFPMNRDLEIMTGALLGIGRYEISVDRYRDLPNWNSSDRNMSGYGVEEEDTYYVNVIGTWDVQTRLAQMNELSSSTIELSSMFFNFQPYIAIKWQVLDRMGLRISAGFNKGTVGQGRWKAYGGLPVNKSPESAIQGITVRSVIYFGL